jgi:hypothetical protein
MIIIPPIICEIRICSPIIKLIITVKIQRELRDNPATAGVSIRFPIFQIKNERNDGNTPIKIIPRIGVEVNSEKSNGTIIKKGMVARNPKNAVIAIVVIGGI